MCETSGTQRAVPAPARLCVLTTAASRPSGTERGRHSQTWPSVALLCTDGCSPRLEEAPPGPASPPGASIFHGAQEGPSPTPRPPRRCWGGKALVLPCALLSSWGQSRELSPAERSRRPLVTRKSGPRPHHGRNPDPCSYVGAGWVFSTHGRASSRTTPRHGAPVPGRVLAQALGASGAAPASGPPGARALRPAPATGPGSLWPGWQLHAFPLWPLRCYSPSHAHTCTRTHMRTRTRL